MYKVMKLAELLREEYREIGNMIILESSTRTKDLGTKIDRFGLPKHYFARKNYHLVGNNVIPYSRLMKIINVLVDLDVLSAEYRSIRAYRGDMTVRVSPMTMMVGIKPCPKPVAYISVKNSSRQDGMIDVYRKFRASVARFFLSDLDTKTQANNEGNSTNDTCSDGTVDVMP